MSKKKKRLKDSWCDNCHTAKWRYEVFFLGDFGICDTCIDRKCK